MQFTMTISFSSIANFFAGELKLVIECAENAMQLNRLISFSYDGIAGVVKAAVQPSMKKGSYSITASHMFNVVLTRASCSCFCTRSSAVFSLVDFFLSFALLSE